MARKSFGPTGNEIIIPDGDTGNGVEWEPVTVTGDGGIAIDDADGESGNAITDSGESVNAGANGTGSNETRNVAYVDPNSVTERKRRKCSTCGILGHSARTCPTTAGARTATTSAKRQTATLITANLEKVLFNLHVMASAMLAEPELVIDETESKILADAVIEVSSAYGVGAMMSPKVQAAVDMAIALGTVYGKRAMTIYAKRSRKPRPVAVMPTGSL